MGNPRSSAASVREQKLARVIDREVAPIWHDRFARLLLRELPAHSGTFVLDIHSGPGHTTAELLQRLDESSRVVALGRDPWLMQVSKTRVRPEWKRRVYFKSGDIDDVPAMADGTYDLAIANLVLGEQVVEWQTALQELLRVTKPGGQVLATLPLHGTWQEVEDLFEELLRDEGMRREVATLQKLRRRRPKPPQLVTGLADLGISEDDFVLEHERFELLFRSGREFLFAPVIEHGPLRLWKAIIGRAEKPQALFWRFKEAIDTYYEGHVLAVTVVAGLIRVRVPGGASQSNFSAQYWSRYPSLSRLWGGLGADLDSAGEDESFDLDLDIEMDIEVEEPSESMTSAADSAASLAHADESGPGYASNELSGLSELPAVEDASLGQDPFAGLLEELDAEEAAAAEIAAEDAAAEAAEAAEAAAAAAAAAGASGTKAAQSPVDRGQTGRGATLGALGDHSSGLRALPRKPGRASLGAPPLRKPGESGSSPLPGKLPPRPSESTTGPIPGKLSGRLPGKLSDRLPRRTESGASPLPGKLSDRLPRRTESGASPLPGPVPGRQPPRTAGVAGVAGVAGRGSSSGKARVAPPPQTGSVPMVGSGQASMPKAVTGPRPSATRAGEDDLFAAMLNDEEIDDALDDIDEIDEIDEIDDFAAFVEGEGDDDLAASFGEVTPDPLSSGGSSGIRPLPPPPPSKKK